MYAKPCSKCKELKTLDQFSPAITGKFGRSSACKKCCTKANREKALKWARNNPEKVKQNAVRNKLVKTERGNI